ncbi:LAME_0B05468g1_1 [Lachancea meyersii CBS 8951]|uniref:Signal recognition particle subunit SRP68 n=1 Tax=Lachancea meyersii CBS 8951 TaxID=1266667 RepID=A0A1G4IVG7_9SACH|nr:LAME_0B05468g1_1 [Lachancea meyersii CBS 8951]
MTETSTSHYSPLGATYGVRIDQFLETAEDFDKYHAKLNRKLQKLRHHCQLTTKDTKRYSAKEKYSKVTHEDYDTKNKLFGTLVLLHAERDLALAETLRLRSHQRGSLKKSEAKVIATRLKKTCQTCTKLLELTQNEQNPYTRAEYLIYHKLAIVSHLSFGKHSKTKRLATASQVAKELSLVFSALQFLQKKEILSAVIVDSITAQFDYLLRQSASSEASSSKELRHFVAKQVNDNADEPLISLLSQNGLEMPSLAQEGESAAAAVPRVQWRRFSAEIGDSKVAEVISEAQTIQPQDLSQYSEKLAKWHQALDLQQTVMEQKRNDDSTENTGEDDEILLTYIQYNSHFTTIERDDILFHKLWSQWTSSSNKSKNLKITKYKEIERIVHNLATYLQQVMDLPGVYSDDTLMANLKLATVYYQLHLSAGCLASFYQGQQKYLEALALYSDGQKVLASAAQDTSLEDPLPGDIINAKKLHELEDFIWSSLKSVISLAEYEKIASSARQSSLELSVVEKLDKHIAPKDVSLSNLFPLRPIIRPISAKPTLFDLAFNYITYDGHSEEPELDEPEMEATQPDQQAQAQAQVPKKKGLFGLFGL